MSAFACPVVRVLIAPLASADFLQVALFGDCRCVVPKGKFQNGDLAVYLPHDAVLPDWLLRQLGFWDEAKQRGTLDGPRGNRVARRWISNTLSDGVLIAGEQIVLAPRISAPGVRVHYASETSIAYRNFEATEDAAAFLGVTRRPPKHLVNQAMRTIQSYFSPAHKYRIRPLHKQPHLFKDGDDVVINEHIDGTLVQIVLLPSDMSNAKLHQGRVCLTTKAPGGRSMLLDHTDMTNPLVRAAHDAGAMAAFGQLAKMDTDQAITLFGVVFGSEANSPGHGYGTTLGFRALDLCEGSSGGQVHFAGDEALSAFCYATGLARARTLYRGPYSALTVDLYTYGDETLSGKGVHLRKGAIVKTAQSDADGHEPATYGFGRKIACAVNKDYALGIVKRVSEAGIHANVRLTP